MQQHRDVPYSRLEMMMTHDLFEQFVAGFYYLIAWSKSVKALLKRSYVPKILSETSWTLWSKQYYPLPLHVIHFGLDELSYTQWSRAPTLAVLS